MEYIYSSTALQMKQREIKEKAREQVVHITENGNGAFVFCSEEVFDNALKQAAADAAYEVRANVAIEQGLRDVEEGRSYSGLEELKAAVSDKRKSCA